jgi:hypothetical protein
VGRTAYGTTDQGEGDLRREVDVLRRSLKKYIGTGELMEQLYVLYCYFLGQEVVSYSNNLLSRHSSQFSCSYI